MREVRQPGWDRSLPGGISFGDEIVAGAAESVSFLTGGDLDGDGDVDLLTDIGDRIVVRLNNGDGTFAAAVAYTVHNDVRGHALGDLDGDGDLDLVTSSSDDHTSVLYNNGDGTFGSPSHYVAGMKPNAIKIADLNGDTHLDVVVSNTDSDDLSVWLNNGDGTLGALAKYASVPGPFGLDTGDFDCDGDVDLVVSDSFGDSVVVYMNNGDATFASPVAYVAGSDLRRVVACDFDKDGYADLATTNGGTDRVSILWNNADGTFAPAVYFPVGRRATYLSAGDLDGDGFPDLAVCCHTDWEIHLLRNRRDGSFASSGFLEPPDRPGPLVLADLDGDADRDVAYVAQLGDAVRGLLNTTGERSIVLDAGEIAENVNFGNYQTVCVSGQIFEDLDGDGVRGPGEDGVDGRTVEFLDPVTGSVVHSTVSRSIDINGDGSIDPASERGLYRLDEVRPGDYQVRQVLPVGWGQTTPSSYPVSLALVSGEDTCAFDFGTAQLVTVEGQLFRDLDDSGTVDPGEPGMSGRTIERVDSSTGTVVQTVTTHNSDVNGDGIIDPETEQGLFVFWDVLPGTYEVRQVIRPGWVQTMPSETAYTIVVTSGLDVMPLVFANHGLPGDINGSKWEDLNGDGRWTPDEPGIDGWAIELVDTTTGSVVETALTQSVDLNNDGSIDPYLEQGLYWFDVPAPGDYEVQEVVPVDWAQTYPEGIVVGEVGTYAVGGQANGTASGDFDGDGDSDLAVVTTTNNGISILMNRGDGSLVLSGHYTDPELLSDKRLQAVDLDGDEDLDLVATSSSSHVIFRFNNGSGEFTTRQTVDMTYDEFSTLIDFAVADLDGDSDPDVAALMRGRPGSSYRWAPIIRLNNGDGTFAAATKLHETNELVVMEGADIDGDGDVDLLLAGDGRFYLLRNNGDGTFAGAESSYDGRDVVWMVVGDVDGDGDVDVVTIGSQGVSVRRNDGGALLYPVHWNDTRYLYHASLDDLNGDGLLDMVCASYYGAFFLPNQGNGQYPDSLEFPAPEQVRYIATVDLNSDGLADVIALGYQSDQVSVLANLTSPGATAHGTYVFNVEDDGVPHEASFGNYQHATISGAKWRDSDGDGVWDADELGLDGWTIELIDPTTNTVIQTTTTQSDDLNGDTVIDPYTEMGLYSLTGIAPGTYCVEEVSQDGWAQTHPSPSTYTLTVNSGDVVEGLDFGNAPPGEIHGRVWHDLDASGARDPGEPYLDGWTVHVYNTVTAHLVGATVTRSVDLNGDTVIDPETETGLYSFTSLRAGTYGVVAVLPSGWEHTLPTAPGVRTISLGYDEIELNADFGVQGLPGEISGQKWHDLDGDGIREPGDPGIDGWVMELVDVATGSVVDTTVTHSIDLNADTLIDPETEQGLYSFTNVPPGTYTIREVACSGWVPAYPPDAFLRRCGTELSSWSASALASADLNQDGFDDLAAYAAPWSSGSWGLIVCINNGTGGWDKSYYYPFGNRRCNGIAAGDLNGDDYPDLALTSYNQNRVGVMLNNGDGTFGAVVTYSVGSAPGHVALGDLDGDEDLDVVVVNESSDTISILFNSGDGSLTGSPQTAAGRDPCELVLVDLDNDDDLDIAVAATGDNAVSIVLSNGDGTFNAPGSIGVAGGLRGIAAGDVDGDGDPDLVVSCPEAWVLINTGGGLLVVSDMYPVAGYGWPSSIVLEDFNGDSWPDVAVTNGNAGKVSVMLNAGRGVFGHVFYFNIGANVSPIVSLDLDGDGALELAVGRSYNEAGAQGIHLFEVEAVGTSQAQGVHTTLLCNQEVIGDVDFGNRVALDGEFTDTYIRPDGTKSLAWGDYDNDGDFDLLVCNRSASAIYRNEDGRLVSLDPTYAGTSDGDVAWVDYDNDGDLDFSVIGSNTRKIYQNDGGTFTDSGVSLQSLTWVSSAWGDYDNDGDPDLAFSGYLADSVSSTYIYRNNGDGTFTELSPGLLGVHYSSMAWGDYDNDGDLDLALTGQEDYGGPYASRIYRNDDGLFVDIGGTLPYASESWMAWGDYDNDNDLDLLIGDELCRNDSGAFVNLGNVVAHSEATAWGDYDNDGDLDLAQAGSYATRVYRNDGGSFEVANDDFLGLSKPSVAWGDYNGDGTLDLGIVGGWYDYATWHYECRIYRNAWGGANCRPAAPDGLSATVVGNEVSLSWNPGNDTETPVTGLTYNLRIGTSPGAGDILGGMADASGWRLIPSMGNAQMALSKTIEVPLGGTYYWSVQAIDSGFAGSTWAPEQTFIIPHNEISGQIWLDADENGQHDPGEIGVNGVTVQLLGQDGRPLTSQVTHGIDLNDDGDIDPETEAGGYVFDEVDGGIYYVEIVRPAGWVQTTPPKVLAFGIKSTYAAKDGTAYVLSDDLDDDGDLDLVVSNAYAEQISVCLNNGDGTYAPQVAYNTDAWPRFFALGNVDGDDDIDIVTANSDEDTAQVFLNSGSGTFSSVGTYAVGDLPRGLTLADLNGDMYLDIATANATSDSVSVLMGNGDGTFVAKVDYPASDGAYFVQAADLDGDGDLDLAVANVTAGTVSVLANSGTGTFGAAVDYATGGGARSISAADFDADGDLDLAVANFSDDNVSVLANNGDGTFAAAVDYAAFDGPWDIISADFDDDGDSDLAVACGNSDDVLLFANQGGGIFISAGAVTAGNEPRSVHAGDWDDDGDVDLATGNFTSDDLTVLLNTTAAYSETLTWGEVITGRDFGGYDDTPPQVADAWVNDREAQHSHINSLSFQFTESVFTSIDVGDLTLYNQTTGQAVDLSGLTEDDLTYDLGTNTATWDLSSVEFAGGDHTGTLLAAGVSDLVGNLLDGDGDGTGGDVYVFSFVVDATPPSLVGVEVNGYSDRQVSQAVGGVDGITSLELTFSEAVDLSAGNILVQEVTFPGGVETLGATVTPSGVTGSGTSVVTVSFASDAIVDTWVKVTLYGTGGSALTDLVGNPLDGEPNPGGSGRGYIYSASTDLPSGDGTIGGDAVFFVGSLVGDASGDARVGFADAFRLNQAWGSQTGDPNYDPMADSSGDGRVGFADAYQLNVHWGQQLDTLPTTLGAVGFSGYVATTAGVRPGASDAPFNLGEDLQSTASSEETVADGEAQASERIRRGVADSPTAAVVTGDTTVGTPEATFPGSPARVTSSRRSAPRSSGRRSTGLADILPLALLDIPLAE